MSDTASQSSAGAASGFIDAEPAQAVNQPKQASRADRARSAAYHKRFVAVYVGLALVVGIGPAPWSSR